jgi:phosphoglycerate dehydrogenase-like enzyme
VTDPEPLPTGHALWSHPKCIITPHLSGDTEGEFDIAADILLENVARIERGEGPVNVVDVQRGY